MHARSPLVGFGVLALLVALGAIVLTLAPADPPADAPAAPAPDPAAAPSSEAPATPPPRAVRLPRPPPVVGTSAAAPALPTRTSAAEPTAPEDGGPVDRREDPGPDAERVRTAIMAGLDVVNADIEACLEDWTEADPAIAGTVRMRFSLGPDGLQEVWIEDRDTVPFGPLSCFSSAVYAHDWSDVRTQPVEVSQVFTLEPAAP